MSRRVLMIVLAIVLVVGGGYFFYRASTSVIYRLTSINFRFENWPALYKAMVNMDADRNFQAIKTFFLEQAGSYMRLWVYGEYDELTEAYAKYGKDFVYLRQVQMKTFCAPEHLYYSTGGYLQFGARLLILPDEDGDGLPDIIAVSYLGDDWEFHLNKHFSLYMPSRQLGALDGSVYRPGQDSGLFAQYLARKSYRIFVTGSYYRPFGYNSEDLDGDGASDFILGDELYVSSGIKADGLKLDVGEGGHPEVTPNSVFLKTGKGTVLVSYEAGKLVVRDWDASARALRTIKEQQLEVDVVTDERPFRIMPLPDVNGDGTEDLAVKDDDELQIYSFEADGSFRQLASLTGLKPQRGHILTGAFGDFDGDGTEDFWVVQTGHWVGDKRIGRAMLVTAKTLAQQAGKTVDIAQIADFTLLGSLDYTPGDGIGATLSLRAGDIDGDGLPDFSTTGHHHISESGALYIVLGKDLQPGGKLEVTDRKVIKLRGNEISQLAPPPVHWDAADYDGDGFDDIVVTADNDLCSGVSTGALHILSGRAILARWNEILAQSAAKD